ncbi:hypothetical protein BGZ54_007129, partial [Gamsiella multidivaricata]
MNMTGASTADLSELPSAVRDRLDICALSDSTIRIFQRYIALNASGTNIATEGVMRLIEHDITTITLHSCYNIDIRALLEALRDFESSNPHVDILLYTKRTQIAMWMVHRQGISPSSSRVHIYQEIAPGRQYDLVASK